MSESETSDLCSLLREKIKASGQDKNDLLRGHLSGMVGIECTDKSEKAFLSFSGEELLVESSTEDEPACKLELSSSDLGALIDGKLNPQIALLSDKIVATGDMTLAMYVCNLFSKEN